MILENLPKEWKWIIRNVEGVLYLFDVEPYKSGFYWEIGKNYISLYEFNHLFQFIKWEDEEPYEIEKLLEKL